jgi:decaprenyl-phosphate phosphoribosyltransferase
MKKLRLYIKLGRPHQYVKNGFIFLPVFFGYNLSDMSSIISTLWAFVVFSLAASSVYVFNDIRDIQEDLSHPKKKFRPLPSGQIIKRDAFLFFSGLVIGAFLLGSLLLPPPFLLILLFYLVLNIAYSLFLKHIAIVDVVCVAIGFVLRVLAGGVAAEVHPSHWLVLMTFLIALFIALAKRRDDLLLAANGNNLRRSLDGYNLEFASNSMMIMAAVTIVSYILYTVSPEVSAKHGSQNLYLTTLWVIIGVMRYMQHTFVYKRSGSPTEVLLKDRFLQAIIILWLLNFFIIINVSGL